MGECINGILWYASTSIFDWTAAKKLLKPPLVALLFFFDIFRLFLRFLLFFSFFLFPTSFFFQNALYFALIHWHLLLYCIIKKQFQSAWKSLCECVSWQLVLIEYCTISKLHSCSSSCLHPWHSFRYRNETSE